MFILKRAPSIFAIAPSALKNAECVTSGMARTSDSFGVPNSRLKFRSPTPLRFGYCGTARIHAYGSFGTFAISKRSTGQFVRIF
jgi:hypothetical protein